MSKEIAQTVGGKRFAWLIALIAAFAVFATVGSQFGHSHATAATDESVIAIYGSTDSVIPIDQTIRTEAAAASHVTALDLTTVDNNSRSTPSSAQLDSSQTSSFVSGLVSAVNPWKTTASTTGTTGATVDSSQISSSTGQSSSLVIGTTNKSPVTYGVLGNAGVNSSVAAVYAPLPLPWERRSGAVVSTASGVEYAPHATVGTLVTQGMSGNGSVFESPVFRDSGNPWDIRSSSTAKATDGASRGDDAWANFTDIFTWSSATGWVKVLQNGVNVPVTEAKSVELNARYITDEYGHVLSTSTVGTSNPLNALPAVSLLTTNYGVTWTKVAGGEGNVGFGKIIDLTNPSSYTLNSRWSSITWTGAGDIGDEAITGGETVEVQIADTGYIIAIIDKHGNVTYTDDRFANSAFLRDLADTIGLLTWTASASGSNNFDGDDTGVGPNSAQLVGEPDDSPRSVSSSAATSSGTSVSWLLFAALALGALAFVSGGVILARRSR